MSYWLGENAYIKWFLFTLVILFGGTLVGCMASNTSTAKNWVMQSPSTGSTPMAEYYVAPDGNDTGSGTSSDPFQTVYRVQQVVRTTLAGGMTGDVVVHLAGGIYALNQTWQFNQSDSGNNGFHVIYQNWTNTAPIISGGQVITGWSPYSNGLWITPCVIPDFRQLYVNGQRATRARGDITPVQFADGDGLTFSVWNIASWKNLQDIEFVFPDVWSMPRIHVDAISGNKIYLQQPSYNTARTKVGTSITMPAWVENALELLGQPGEWYLDKTSHLLYYMPRAGENMASAQVFAPTLQTLLAVEGNETQKVANLQFNGLTFTYGTWLEPNQYGVGFVDIQANFHIYYEGLSPILELSPGNVYTRFAENISFTCCTFTHMGSTALDLQAGTTQSSVIGNRIIDNSGIGIQIGEVDHPLLDPSDSRVVRDIDVKNNYITNCSVEYCGGPGIFTGYVRSVHIEHNTISNLPYTAISVGWGASATVTVCGYNTVKYNRIYGVVTFLADGAGIYTFSTQPGTDISYNAIHDSGWNGLYPDERTNSTTWTYNVVWDCYNSIQNHIMYYNDPIANPYALNNISNNYLAEYPWFVPHPPCWDTLEGPYQIYGLYPGNPNFPQDIVDASGVEPAFAWILPVNEWYWHYKNPTTDMNPIASDPVVAWLVLIGFMSFIGIGAAILWRTKEKTAQAQLEDANHLVQRGGPEL